ncbi:MAG: ABC transporter ATP-binding protein [Bacteroidales bacterium]|nr:ABC transporter ATP-binding protein [Bacteroidales bacterium]
MATAIEFNHVSKLYRLGLVSTGTFREDVKRWWITSVQKKEDPYLTIGETNDRGTKGESQFVWALRDIDFKVEQGDVVGIIGKNGAGKSTLLKLLSRITSPTTGDIRAKGRIASLLEVGTGFHPEMTGRENIYLNGAILGMTKEEIARKLDEIIDFSGCERYIDTPVKRYSSGMRVRLGFAVAAHLDPDILVVDEVLAVGDLDFQKKAIGKMKEVSTGGGRTVLFVSHNMNSIRKLCKTGILLKNGTVECSGAIDDVIAQYTKDYYDAPLSVFATQPEDRTKDHQILEMKLMHVDGTPAGPYIEADEEIYLYIKYLFNSPAAMHLTFTIATAEEETVLFNERSDYYNDFVKVESGYYESTIKIPNPLLKPNTYYITAAAMNRGTKILDTFKNALSYEILPTKVFRQIPRQGNLYIPLEWPLNRIS